MKNKILAFLAVVTLLLFSPGARAAGTNEDMADLKALISQIQTKLHDGKRTEAELSDELKQFDVLIAKHKGEKRDVAAQIVYMKAMLYLEVFEEPAKGTEMIKQIKRDYPDTAIGKRADEILATLAKQEAAKKILAGFVIGSKLPDFNEKDINGKSFSIGNYKGNVVLVDFWATWCGPCVAELPNVLETYQKHHAQGFEIVSISLDEDQHKLESFIKEKNMTWQQFFDGKGWGNKLAAKYGVQSIPATFLLDGNGNIIAKDLRGEELEIAVSKALAKK